MGLQDLIGRRVDRPQKKNACGQSGNKSVLNMQALTINTGRALHYYYDCQKNNLLKGPLAQFF